MTASDTAGVAPGFATDTRVHRVGEGRWVAEVLPGYGVIGGSPNGGYLTALAARALAGELDRPHPVTATTHYLDRPTTGPVELRTRTLRAGGRHATGVVEVWQDDRQVLQVTGTFTDLARAEGPTHLEIAPPELPPRDECVDLAAQDDTLPFMHRVRHHATWDSVGFARGEPPGRGLFEGWTRLPDREPVDPIACLFLADAVPPPVLNTGIAFGWVPTVELTVHVRRVPARGWLRMRFTTQALTDGYLETDGQIWDADDRLVVLCRQLALAPREAS